MQSALLLAPRLAKLAGAVTLYLEPQSIANRVKRIGGGRGKHSSEHKCIVHAMVKDGIPRKQVLGKVAYHGD